MLEPAYRFGGIAAFATLATALFYPYGLRPLE